jgi:Glyoxalase/Bleomycin resistance protein/Dioxygenase superfamily
LHGPIHHLAYVVEDLEATVERLVAELGAGPFFVLRDVAFEQVTSRGEPATFDHDSAFGQCGALPIEVMQLKRLEPERVREGFSLPPPQLHHAAYVVAPERLAQARDDLERRGLPAYLTRRRATSTRPSTTQRTRSATTSSSTPTARGFAASSR